MGLEISKTLYRLGFFCTLGLVERKGDISAIIGCGIPGTYDTKKGVIVVYDENGHPWITEAKNRGKLEQLMAKHAYLLRRGAYVPHSSDGGNFVNHVLPGLRPNSSARLPT